MAGYVYISFALGCAMVPLALYVPAPRLLVRRAALCGLVLLTISVGLLVASGVMIVSMPDCYPGIAVGLLSVSVFVLMIWTAGSATSTRRPPDENEDGGSGGGGGRGPRRPPEPPKPTDGLGLDWGDFDRLRHEWAAERREPARA